jgi:hypothetical protein
MRNRDQRTETDDQEFNRMQRLLQRALPPVGEELEPDRDLWPAMLRRMDQKASPGISTVPWFDWALGGALLAFAAFAPRTIPVILYYL